MQNLDLDLCRCSPTQAHRQDAPTRIAQATESNRSQVIRQALSIGLRALGADA